MTEAEWLACADPTPMLEYLRDDGGEEENVSERKLMLFAVTCCERLPAHTFTPRLVIEFNTLEATILQVDGQSPVKVVGEPTGYCCDAAIDVAVATSARANNGYGDAPAQAAFLRCIFGNPFRPDAFDPDWLTSTVGAIGEGIYAERAFDRLPILADALQDAGCDNDDILTHCRSDGPHVRGCWVVDLILGKS